LVRPHVAEQPSLSRQPVEGIVALGHGADLAAQSKGGGGVEGTAVSIDVDDTDLHGGVVFRSDQSVGSRAFAGDVEINEDTGVVFHFEFRAWRASQATMMVSTTWKCKVWEYFV